MNLFEYLHRFEIKQVGDVFIKSDVEYHCGRPFFGSEN